MGYVEKNIKRPETIKKQIDGDIIPLLGDKELDTLQTVDITAALDIIVARGAPVHVNRVLSSINTKFISISEFKCQFLFDIISK